MAKDKEFFSDENIAQAAWFKFDKIGDAVKGTLLSRRHQPGVDNYPAQEVYELKQEDGDIINVGFSVNKKYVLDRMRNVKIGQIVGFMFKSEIPSKTKGYAPAKSIEVYVGKMDENYKAEALATETGGKVVDEEMEGLSFSE